MLKRAIHLVGIDQAVFFSLLNKIAAISFGMVTLALVISRFSPDQQGYYYTFTSLLVLQAFLELGMGVVLVQFVSHEWAKLRLTESGCIVGDDIALRRTASMVGVGLQWYLAASTVFFVAVGPLGIFLLDRHEHAANVSTAWWVLCAAVSISILQIPLRSFLEGSNQIPLVQKLATVVLASSSVAGWIAISSDLGLYALSITAGTNAVLGLALFGRACTPFLRLASRKSPISAFSWRKEFWPQQWRTAISWMCGFFMFQSFVPVLFYNEGAIVAGRMGASLQIYNAINSIASSWIYARGPRLGMLGAMGKVSELRSIVRAALIRSSAVASIAAVLALASLALMTHFNYKADRFIGVYSMAALLATAVVLQRSNVETLAVRFQKVEPFVPVSVLTAIIVFISNVAMSKFYGVFAVCVSFGLIVGSVLTPWVHRLYVDIVDASGLATRANDAS
jgi:hypothetical protein